MIEASEIEATLKAAMPDAIVQLTDLTGGADHWEGVIISDAFDGVGRVDRRRLVHGPLADALVQRLHAFTFRTHTKAEALAAGLLKTES